MAFQHLWPDHRVADRELVLQREEDNALGRARPLPHQHDTRHRDGRTVAQGLELRRVRHLALSAQAAEELHGVRLQGEFQRLIIIHHMLGERHVRKHHISLLPLLARIGEGEERQRLGFRQRLHLPQRCAPVEAQRAEAVGRGEFLKTANRHAKGLEIGDGQRLLLRAVL